jgi:predicted secreted Zn-dependent protease
MSPAGQWESGITWVRASFCGGGECVEVARSDGMILVRDSKQPAGSVLQYSSAEWQAFISGVKTGEFDHLT